MSDSPDGLFSNKPSITTQQAEKLEANATMHAAEDLLTDFDYWSKKIVHPGNANTPVNLGEGYTLDAGEFSRGRYYRFDKKDGSSVYVLVGKTEVEVGYNETNKEEDTTVLFRFDKTSGQYDGKSRMVRAFFGKFQQLLDQAKTAK
jgi:hypothetical protein